uniref:Uncharacterized protein n=1 Tax=Anguilla anguilla TaxID=7936 RepID=A0A0E9SEH9_ANGAN
MYPWQIYLTRPVINEILLNLNLLTYMAHQSGAGSILKILYKYLLKSHKKLDVSELK